ncbi:hypothetical protein [Burkholderia singularis]|nr:hypothetical protein [Burkholderia singularis]
MFFVLMQQQLQNVSALSGAEFGAFRDGSRRFGTNRSNKRQKTTAKRRYPPGGNGEKTRKGGEVANEEAGAPRKRVAANRGNGKGDAARRRNAIRLSIPAGVHSTGFRERRFSFERGIRMRSIKTAMKGNACAVCRVPDRS